MPRRNPTTREKSLNAKKPSRVRVTRAKTVKSAKSQAPAKPAPAASPKDGIVTKRTAPKVNIKNHVANPLAVLPSSASMFRKVWTGAELDRAIAEAGEGESSLDGLIARLNREGIEISLGHEEAPEEPRPARTRNPVRGDENSDPLAILFREAQRSPRPTRDEERRLFQRVLFTRRRLDSTLADLNYPREATDAFY